MKIVKTNQEAPGSTGEIQVWRDRGSYFVGRCDKAVRIAFTSLMQNFRQLDGSPIDPEKIPQEWPTD